MYLTQTNGPRAVSVQVCTQTIGLVSCQCKCESRSIGLVSCQFTPILFSVSRRCRCHLHHHHRRPPPAPRPGPSDMLQRTSRQTKATKPHPKHLCHEPSTQVWRGVDHLRVEPFGVKASRAILLRSINGPRAASTGIICVCFFYAEHLRCPCTSEAAKALCRQDCALRTQSS
jgi:hypothetical protein